MSERFLFVIRSSLHRQFLLIMRINSETKRTGYIYEKMLPTATRGTQGSVPISDDSFKVIVKLCCLPGAEIRTEALMISVRYS